MYLQDSNALLLMFLSYFTLDYYKLFGYRFDILIIGRQNVYSLMLDFLIF